MTWELSVYTQVAAPPSTNRLIPSRFPPVAVFDGVASADDLAAAMELEGWTNDRLVETRLSRLDREEWVFGQPNSSIVMAAFLHGSIDGMRFSDAQLGAWYCATDLATAALEVANGLRKEISLSDGLDRKVEIYRQYRARLDGRYVDLFGRHPEFFDPDDSSYPAPQIFGRQVRDQGRGLGISGIRYESVRHKEHESWVCFRPQDIRDVIQADHFEIDVPRRGKVVVRKLPG